MSATQLSVEQFGEEFGSAVRALWFDLPAAALRLSLGVDTQQQFAAVAWRSYDSGVKVAGDLVAGLLNNPLYNELTTKASLLALRPQRALGRIGGEAAAREISALRGRLAALSEEVDELRETVVAEPARRKLAAASAARSKVGRARPAVGEERAAA